MKVTINDLQRKFEELARDGFTGESILRFAGSRYDGLIIVPTEIKNIERPVQDMALIMSVYSLCRRCDAFGSITLIWHEGSIKNFTVKLTFQGADTPFLAKNIFQCGP